MEDEILKHTDRRGWMKDEPIYLGSYASGNFLPTGCPNCLQLIEVEEATLKMGFYRHRKCWGEVVKHQKVG